MIKSHVEEIIKIDRKMGAMEVADTDMGDTDADIFS